MLCLLSMVRVLNLLSMIRVLNLLSGMCALFSEWHVRIVC